MNVFSFVGFLQTGLWSILAGVSILWMFRRIEETAALRLLAPVLLLHAASSLVLVLSLGMEWFIIRYSGAIYEIDAFHLRLTGPYGWVYVLIWAATILPLVFLIPRARQSMKLVSMLTLPAFAVHSRITTSIRPCDPPHDPVGQRAKPLI